MDPNLLAFLLSCLFTAIAYVLIMAFIGRKKGPDKNSDAPRGPITVDL